MSFEEFIAAGLYDPDSPRADERRELLEHLLSRGFATEEIIAAHQRVGPVSIAANLTSIRRRFVSPRAIAEKCNVDLDLLLRLRLALGVPFSDPDEDCLDESVSEVVALFQLAREQFGEEATLAFVRVLGSGVTRLMEAGRAMLGAGVVRASATELETSQRNEAAVGLWRVLPPVIGDLMRERASRDNEFLYALLDGDVRVAACFVDLVGSTEWTTTRTPLEHAAALTIFERAAWDVAGLYGGRVVKLIGDEAMIVAADPVAACRIADDLCAAVGREPSLPHARGAVGLGPVTARDGDYFGPLVNLVARATKAAQPGGVVVTSDVGDRLDQTEWVLTSQPATQLRGIDEPIALVDIARRE